MNIVITMAGLGTRFREAGYLVPKYQIVAKGKTLFEWSLMSLDDFRRLECRYIFIVRREDQAEAFIREQCEKKGLRDYRCIELDAPTDGQATTAMHAAPFWDEQRPLLIYNIDTYVEPGAIRVSDVQGDGFIPCFQAEGEHWSFVRLDENGRAVEVREKRRISDNCTLGAYYFRSCRLYRTLYEKHFGMFGTEKGERYVAPLYNTLIQEGGDVRISMVDADKIHVLGTPQELAVFESKS